MCLGTPRAQTDLPIALEQSSQEVQSLLQNIDAVPALRLICQLLLEREKMAFTHTLKEFQRHAYLLQERVISCLYIELCLAAILDTPFCSLEEIEDTDEKVTAVHVVTRAVECVGKFPLQLLPIGRKPLCELVEQVHGVNSRLMRQTLAHKNDNELSHTEIDCLWDAINCILFVAC